MLLQKEREQVVEFCRKMSEKNLSAGTSGNISVKMSEKNLVALSPSGMDYFQMKPEDVVVIDSDGNIVDGTRKPSSEWRLHTDFYKHNAEVSAIVHTHSTYCTVFACLGIPVKAIHYVIAGAGVNEIPVAPYRTFGTKELSDAVSAAAGNAKGVLLANHGMLAGGADINKAFSLAVNMEFCAELQYRCVNISTPNYLTDEQMAAVRERMKTYGQTKMPEKE